MSTKIMPITDLRRQTKEVIQNVREHGDIVYITQYGRPSVVLIDYDRYEALMAQLQQMRDWPENYFEETYGSLADDPLVRAEQPAYDERDALQ